MNRALDRKPESNEERQAYYDRIGGLHLAPLWEVLHQLLAKTPVTDAVPNIWKYETLRPALLDSARLISAAEAERRVLVLENPAMPGRSCITETLYAGLQLIMPGEIAPTHRHTPAALRFIIEGSGAYTAINGERVFMEPGDLILTPSWVWHDHGHAGDVPVVWLDGLDIPLIRHSGPTFTESYPKQLHPAGRSPGDNLARFGANMAPADAAPATANSPVVQYLFKDTFSILAHLAKSGECDCVHGIKMQYINPTNGGPVMPTLGCFMQLLPRGFHSNPYRSTPASVYAVAQGAGRSFIGDAVIEWKENDVFVIPSWYPHRHEADRDSYLFSFTDKPVHDKLGWFRESTEAT